MKEAINMIGLMVVDLAKALLFIFIGVFSLHTLCAINDLYGIRFIDISPAENLAITYVNGFFVALMGAVIIVVASLLSLLIVNISGNWWRSAGRRVRDREHKKAMEEQ